MLDVLWKPWKLIFPVTAAVVIPIACLFMLFVLIVYFTILDLPFPQWQEEAMAWFLNNPYPEGVLLRPEYADHTGPLPPSAFALDTGRIEDWFGGPITAGFHDPAYQAEFGRVHNGVDVSLRVGTPIPAAMGGHVVYAGWSGGYGNLVIVQNGSWRTYYGHLSAFGAEVGQEVGRGDTVALSGNTGFSTGPHLHYEVRYDNVPVAPTTYPGADGSEGESPEEP